MKKLILSIFLSLLYICTSYADTILNYGNSIISECPSEVGLDTGAGPRTKYGVPKINGNGQGITGNLTCITHYYYNSGDYQKDIIGSSYTTPTTYPNGVTNCGHGERVVGMHAGNNGWYIICRKYDDTPPSNVDVANSVSIPPDGSNLLANHSRNFRVTIPSNGGSPINTFGSIKVFFEKYNTNNELSGTSNEYRNGNNENISLVDIHSQRSSNGSRQYSLRVSKVCDEAGNCLGSDSPNSNLKTYNYNVYANTLPSYMKEGEISLNQVDDNINIADGTDKKLVISLKDIYGNQIIPATGIGRTIDFNFNVKNTMYLNQQSRTGQSSVFLTSSNSSDYTNKFSIGEGINAINNQSSSNGDYTYNFKVYTPTKNQNSLPISDINAELTFNNITFDINATQSLLLGDTPQAQVVSGGLFSTKFSPLYYTSITGDLKNGGFIEGIIQDSYLEIKTGVGGSTSGISNKKTYLIFSGALNNVTLKYDLKYSKSGIPSAIISETPVLSTNFGNTSSVLRTLMSLVTPPVLSNMKAYLSTHISYDLDGKNIVYNSDIIGKDSYFGMYTSSDANQSGLNVIGISSSKNNTSIIEDQIPNDVKIIGNTDKLILKTSIVKNGYSFAKNVTGYTDLITDHTLDSIDIPDIGTHVNNVIYFGSEYGNANKVYQLGNGGDISINTNKTILVIGGNLYINSNLYYSSTNSMLGIVVLKDKQGYGGNVYISPNVTNIVGSIFADKSIISYNGTRELDGNAVQSELKNQLHIYGNIFSENTIGGSRKTTPQCPYYVSLTDCNTKEKAQKYDLNYLRRYYLIDASLYSGTTGIKIPANNGKIIGGGVCNIYTGVCTGGNTNFARNITDTTQQYSNNSVLIEYNPNVQLNPPPLFKINVAN